MVVPHCEMEVEGDEKKAPEVNQIQIGWLNKSIIYSSLESFTRWTLLQIKLWQ